ncbi:hypothetical protein [Actinacidiphila sp. bgisy144]|uniref:hypothetical protein n=1 Tax=unclassified Actinacidiphila TaxID=2995708 RepID=UPI003EBC0C7F
MTVTSSAVLVFGIASFFALKSKSTNASGAILLFLFGFFVAGTGAAQPIHDLTASFARFLSDIG